jgi:hypothetical protein
MPPASIPMFTHAYYFPAGCLNTFQSRAAFFDQQVGYVCGKAWDST